jgi:radical SAM-linked protein
MERLLIKFTKIKEAKFISHLDLMRTLNRAFRRAAIPVSHSKGFNPHSSLSLAAPLSVGTASHAEYGDVEIESNIPEQEIMIRLNEVLPAGIRMIDIKSIEGKVPPSMALVEGSKYTIKFTSQIDKNEGEELVRKILSVSVIERLKRTKSGEKVINIRPMIHQLNYLEGNSENACFECLISTGSKGNLNPDVLVEVIKENSNGKIYGYAEIIRNELYTLKDMEWIELNKFVLGK